MAIRHWRSDNLHFRNFSFVAPRALARWPGWTLLLIPDAEVDPEDLPPVSAAPTPLPTISPSPSS